jgi:hypothetical protein
MCDINLAYLLSVHGSSDIRQTEIHAAVPLIPEPSRLEVEDALEKVKRYKLTVLVKFQVGGETYPETNFLILFGVRKNFH